MAGINGIAGIPDTYDMSKIDMSTQMLSDLFGNLGPFHGMDNIFSGIMPMWNGLMISIAGLIVGYTVFVSILSTAHEGEMLGKAWSSVWIPLRTALGVALLVPAMGGYSPVQHGVGYVIGGGVYIANNMWDSAVDYLAKTGGAVIHPHQPDRSLMLIRSAYLQSVCVAATNLEYRLVASGSGEKEAQQLALTYFNTRDGVINSLSSAGDALYPSEGWKYTNPVIGSACGGYEWTAISTAKTRLGIADSQGMMSYNFTELVNGNISDAITNQQKIATKELLDYMRPIAENFVNTGNTPTLQKFLPAVQNYNKTMGTALNNSQKWAETQGMKEFVDQSKKDGWIVAGTFFNRINQLNMALNEAATSGSNTIDMDVSPPDAYNSEVTNFIEDAKITIDNISKDAQPGVSEAYNDQLGQSNDLGSKALSTIKHPTTKILDGVLIAMQSEANPLARMQTIGNLILDTVGATITAGSVAAMTPTGKIASIATKVTSKLSGGVISQMSGMLISFATTAFVIGILMAVVIPLIPYIIWTLSVISWMVSCVIAVVAASLWAAAHCSPEGHNVAGGGTNGYPILLGLLMRPALMVIGLFSAILVMTIGDTFITRTFMTSFSIANSNNIVGPFIMMGTLVVYCTIEMMLLYASFRLVQTLPNAILEWVGGRSDDALGVEQHADRANHMIVGGMASVKGLAMKGGSGKGGEEGGGADSKVRNSSVMVSETLSKD